MGELWNGHWRRGCQIAYTKQGLFAVPPLSLLPRYARSIEDLCALGHGDRSR